MENFHFSSLFLLALCGGGHKRVIILLAAFFPELPTTDSRRFGNQKTGWENHLFFSNFCSHSDVFLFVAEFCSFLFSHMPPGGQWL